MCKSEIYIEIKSSIVLAKFSSNCSLCKDLLVENVTLGCGSGSGAVMSKLLMLLMLGASIV